MNREEILVIVSILLFIQGYLYINIIPLIMGLGILLYVLSIRLSFNPIVDIEMLNHNSEYCEDEEIILKFNIKNNSKIPLIIDIKKNNPYFTWSSEKITLQKCEETEYILKLIPKKTGHFTFKNFVFRITDINTIYFKDIKLNFNCNFNISPSISSLKKEIEINKNIKLGMNILHNLKTGFDGLEFEELREYVKGDNYKHIDWKASSKMDRLIVKEFLNETESPVYILVDVSSEFRRELSSNKSKVNYINILIQGIINTIILKNKQCNIIFFDNNSVKQTIYKINKINGLESIKKTINQYLKPVKGFPNLNTIINKNRGGLYKAQDKIVGGDIFIITDGALKYHELMDFVINLKNKNANSYIISLNPILFLDERQLNMETIPKIYQKYIEREEIIKKLNYLCPTVDLGPNERFGWKV